MTETHIKGLDQLQTLLDQLPAKVEANILRGALRAAAKPILAEAKQNAAQLSGEMRKGLKISTKKRGANVTASIKAGGKHGYIAHWVEFGTAAHTITGKDGRPMYFGGTFVLSVDHPGARARPFMRPAVDAKTGEALVAAGEYIKKRLANKHGLDTSDIQIEGDD